MKDWIKEFVNVISNISMQINEDFDWIDIGAAESMDLYLLPLLGLEGNCLTIDVDSINSPELEYDWKRANIVNIDSLLDSECGQRFFYLNGTGSTLYPNQDIIGERMFNRKREFTCIVKILKDYRQ